MRGAGIVISQRPQRAYPIGIDHEIYKWRHLVENFFCKLKEFKRIALRSEKTDASCRVEHSSPLEGLDTFERLASESPGARGVPIAFEGHAPCNIQNTMATAAAADTLGPTLGRIRIAPSHRSDAWPDMLQRKTTASPLSMTS